MWNFALVVKKFLSLEIFYTTPGSGGSDYYQVCSQVDHNLWRNVSTSAMNTNLNLSIWQIFSTRGTCDKYQACNCCYLAKLKQIFGWLSQLVEAKKADILMKRLCIKYVLSTCSIGRGGVSKCTLLKNARQQRSFWTSPVQLNWSRLHLFWKICRNTHFFCC